MTQYSEIPSHTSPCQGMDNTLRWLTGLGIKFHQLKNMGNPTPPQKIVLENPVSINTNNNSECRKIKHPEFCLNNNKLT